jgi:hypothetical protein
VACQSSPAGTYPVPAGPPTQSAGGTRGWSTHAALTGLLLPVPSVVAIAVTLAMKPADTRGYRRQVGLGSVSYSW